MKIITKQLPTLIFILLNNVISFDLVIAAENCLQDYGENNIIPQAQVFEVDQCVEGSLPRQKSLKGDQDAFLLKASSKPRLITVAYTLPITKAAPLELVLIKKNDKGLTVKADRIWKDSTERTKTLFIPADADNWYFTIAGESFNNSKYRLLVKNDPLPKAIVSENEILKGPSFVLAKLNTKGKLIINWSPTKKGLYDFEVFSEPMQNARFEILGKKDERIVLARDWQKTGYLTAHQIFSESSNPYRLAFKGKPNSEFVIKISANQNKKAEREPNDKTERAIQIDGDIVGKGILLNSEYSVDVDNWSFTIPDEAKGFRSTIRTSFNDVSVKIELKNEAGTIIQTSQGKTHADFENLALEPGRYFLEFEAKTMVPKKYHFKWLIGEKLTDSMEQEPNDNKAFSSPLKVAGTTKGYFHGKERDSYQFEVVGEPQLWRLLALGDGLKEMSLYHYSSGKMVMSKRAKGARRIRLDQVLLWPGKYHVVLDGKDGRYLLRTLPLGIAPEDVLAKAEADNKKMVVDTYAKIRPLMNRTIEHEPNNTVFTAQKIKMGQTIRGTLNTGVDIYRFSLKGDQNIRLSLTNEGNGGISYADIFWGKQRIQYLSTRPGAQTSELELQLKAGEYFIKLYEKGLPEDAFYSLSLDFVSIFSDPNMNVEPDSESDPKHILTLNKVTTGRLQIKDKDHFLIEATRNSRSLKLCLLDDVSKLKGTSYTAKIYHRNPVKNDKIRDYYETFKIADRVTIKPVQSPQSSTKCEFFEQPANQELYVNLERYYSFENLINYEIILLPADQPINRLMPTAKLLSLSLKPSLPFASFVDWQQKSTTLLTLKNKSSTVQIVNLRMATNHDGIKVSSSKISAKQIKLSAGEELKVLLTIVASPDVNDNQPVWLEVAAYQDNNIIHRARINITPSASVDALSPSHWLPYDNSALGGLIVSHPGFGGKIIEPNNQGRIGYINGLTDTLVNDNKMQHGSFFPEWKQLPYIAFSGQSPMKISGVILTPGWGDQPKDSIKDFAIEISNDATNWQEILRDKLHAVGSAKAFSFPAIIEARFIRLVPLSNYSNEIGSLTRLAEFKAIAPPETQPEAIPRINLALSELGGHIVYASPDLSTMYELAFKSNKNKTTFRKKQANEGLLVMGFHNNRTAAIDEITIKQVPQKFLDQGYGIKQFSIERSLESPAGPWEAVWSGELAQQGDITKKIQLSKEANGKSVWARFLRFKYPVGEKGLMRPSEIKVFESKSSTELTTISFLNKDLNELKSSKKYRSILGAWGDISSLGPKEWAYPKSPKTKNKADPQNDQLAGAIPLPVNGMAKEGWVKRGEDIDWYRIVPNKDTNRLSIVLEGIPVLSADFKVFDKDQKEIPILSRVEDANKTELILDIINQEPVWVRVEDPPTSIVVTWDTSGSTNPLHPFIYQSIFQFALKLRPDLETVNLVPFGSNQLLLQDFSSDRLEVIKALTDIGTELDSSDSSSALIVATKGLKNQIGRRSIIHITDAATSRSGLLEAWTLFSEIRPSISNLALSSSGALSSHESWELDYMQDWSASNFGYYQYTGFQVSMLEHGLERTFGRLNRTTVYNISATSYFEEIIPGSLLLKKAKLSEKEKLKLKKKKPLVRNIYFILDASGSMLKQLNGTRRINIAKQAIISAAGNKSVKNDALSLRVFGLGGSGSCQTKIMVKPAQNNFSKLKNTLKKISPVDGAKTAIADSIKAAAGDLSDKHSSSLLLLITDGEETCDGDPEKVIQDLRNKGINLQVSIIGFALDDEKLKAEFKKWAELGGGEYYDAADSKALNQAVKKATVAPKPAVIYNVYSKNKKLMGQVKIGQQLELPPGIYTVQEAGSEKKSIEVKVVSKKQTTQEIK